jgi:hypothetical protein
LKRSVFGRDPHDGTRVAKLVAVTPASQALSLSPTPMKTLLLLLGAIAIPVLAAPCDPCRVTCSLAATSTSNSTKSAPPSQPSSPTGKTNGKETKKRPAPPAHLLM